MMACRAGMLKAKTVPLNVAATSRCQYSIRPTEMSTATARFITPSPSWLIIRRSLFCIRSARTPPRRDRRSMGAPQAALTRPSLKAEPVSSYASHAWAGHCICMPMKADAVPSQYQR